MIQANIYQLSLLSYKQYGDCNRLIDHHLHRFISRKSKQTYNCGLFSSFWCNWLLAGLLVFVLQKNIIEDSGPFTLNILVSWDLYVSYVLMSSPQTTIEQTFNLFRLYAVGFIYSYFFDGAEGQLQIFMYVVVANRELEQGLFQFIYLSLLHLMWVRIQSNQAHHRWNLVPDPPPQQKHGVNGLFDHSRHKLNESAGVEEGQ